MDINNKLRFCGTGNVRNVLFLFVQKYKLLSMDTSILDKEKEKSFYGNGHFLIEPTLNLLILIRNRLNTSISYYIYTKENEKENEERKRGKSAYRPISSFLPFVLIYSPFVLICEGVIPLLGPSSCLISFLLVC